VIIRKLKLEPFGCFASKEMDFKDGLNVIIGPNETGKSTAFYAIQKVLFTSSKLTKNESKREINRFLPIDGDTANVEISFIINKNPFSLERTWGGTKTAALKLSDGTLITDEEKILKELDEILPATAGTFKSVLMTYQSGLVKTIEDLKTDYHDTIQTLGDILRMAVLETGGVSIDQFRERINDLCQEYLSHWDQSKDMPEKGRGIENPWKKEVGLILENYYYKEQIKANLENTRKYEEELDNINQQITSHAEKISANEEYINKNKKAVEDARERKTLDAELSAHKTTIEKFTKINSDWPVRESKIQDLEKQLPELEKKEQFLSKEWQDSEREEGNKTLREQFKKIKAKKTNLENSLKKLGDVQKLTKKNLEEIEKVETDMNTLETKISAGKLTLKLKTKKSISLKVHKDIEDSQQLDLSADQLQKIEAGGILRIEHIDWNMEITSGEGDINMLLSQYNISKEKCETLLKQYNVDSRTNAHEIYEIYEKSENKVKVAQELLDSDLGDESYENLKSKIDEIGDEKTARPLVDVVQDLATIKNKQENIGKEKNEHEKVIAEYQNYYEDKSKLLLEFAEKSHQLNEIQEKIGNLTFLPEGISDLGKFIEKYEKVKDELKEGKDLLNNYKLQIARLEGQAPDMSAEELESQLSDTDENFMRTQRKGEAIYKIKELTDVLVEQLDRDTHVGLKNELERYISAITGNRYDKVALDGSLPEGFIRGDGKTIPYEFLSTGTKDALSLSLRLSMANYFLKEANGFIVMDDPLVDLDPERQKNASKLLQEFAGNKQVIVFTCHPANSKLLGGNQINLEY
jgi:DNA repair protein SbcC/Rad50